MKYNKNIVLNILSSEFFEQIKEYTLECIWDLDESELYYIIDEDAEIADLDYIDRITVIDYEVKQKEEIEYFSGTLEVFAYIDGYIFHDGENLYAGSGTYNSGMRFRFEIYRGEYSNLELEHIY